MEKSIQEEIAEGFEKLWPDGSSGCLCMGDKNIRPRVQQKCNAIAMAFAENLVGTLEVNNICCDVAPTVLGMLVFSIIGTLASMEMNEKEVRTMVESERTAIESQQGIDIWKKVEAVVAYNLRGGRIARH